MEAIYEEGRNNKITFAPEKTEVIHIIRRRTKENPAISLSDRDIQPIPLDQSGTKVFKVPGLRWLGFWFDRKNTGRRYVEEKSAKALAVANYLRGLAGVKYGPPIAALRKAAIAYVLLIGLYAAEA